MVRISTSDATPRVIEVPDAVAAKIPVLNNMLEHAGAADGATPVAVQTTAGTIEFVMAWFAENDAQARREMVSRMASERYQLLIEIAAGVNFLCIPSVLDVLVEGIASRVAKAKDSADIMAMHGVPNEPMTREEYAELCKRHAWFETLCPWNESGDA